MLSRIGTPRRRREQGLGSDSTVFSSRLTDQISYFTPDSRRQGYDEARNSKHTDIAPHRGKHQEGEEVFLLQHSPAFVP